MYLSQGGDTHSRCFTEQYFVLIPFLSTWDGCPHFGIAHVPGAMLSAPLPDLLPLDVLFAPGRGAGTLGSSSDSDPESDGYASRSVETPPSSSSSSSSVEPPGIR